MAAKSLTLVAVNRFAAAISRERLHPRVLAWAEHISPRARWSVAFSGGADSLALLLLLWAYWPERRRQLQVLHFNHRLRGRASRTDATFCAAVCETLGVSCVVGEWHDAHKRASEAEARTARLAFFQKHSRVLWLGHHQDDIAESMLMRLARGSGTAGLAAPRPIQRMPLGRTHLRPLLTLKKQEILSALRSAKITWREDATNAGDDFFRNRVRGAVLPSWEKASGRDARGGAALARELLEEDDDALEQWLIAVAPLTRDGDLDLLKLEGKPRALVRRALHRWLAIQPGIGELSRQGFERLLEAVMKARDTRQSLGTTAFAVIARGRLHREQRESANRTKRKRRFPRSIN